MTTEPLLTISAFARAVDLAPSTLRYYDEAGLLPPAEVDSRTGYRYYTPDLERRAVLIRRMRELGLPVETMRLVLAGPTDDAARILRDHAEGARRTAREAAGLVEEIVAALAPDTDVGRVVVTVDGAELATALRHVAPVASTDDPPLQVVLLDLSPGTITAVATDRYRLARWSVPTAEAHTPDRRVVLATERVTEVAALLERSAAATLAVDANGLTVGDAGSVTVIATEPDRFPAYRLIMPPAETGRVTVGIAELRDAVVAVAEGPARLETTADVLLVGGYGDAAQRPVRAIGTGSVTVWLSRDLLLSVLDTLVGTTVTLTWTGPAAAVRLTPVEQRRLDVVVMPVRPPGWGHRRRSPPGHS